MARRSLPLPDGPLDIIGDVHGELEALLALLAHLGVDVERGRAERPLVFVGDLVDRGPDSVGVVEVFERLAAAGLAHAVLGNHELNLLREDRKPGNHWYWGEAEDGFASRVAQPGERARVRGVLQRLPLVLERPDVRVVHAMWDRGAFEALPDEGDWADVCGAREAQQAERLKEPAFAAALAREAERYANLRDERLEVVYLPAHARQELILQDNPVKLLTSGGERDLEGARPFFRERWRFVERRRWWTEAPVDRPTVIGHYWRASRVVRSDRPEPWDDVAPFSWINGVFCVDYSVGRRYAYRRGRPSHPITDAAVHCRLASLRWPERTLVFDDGQVLPTHR